MIYEYRCAECGRVFSQRFPFTENPESVKCLHPQCPGQAERFFGTVPPICFMGNGWAGKGELDAMDPQNNNPQDFTEFTGV